MTSAGSDLSEHYQIL